MSRSKARRLTKCRARQWDASTPPQGIAALARPHRMKQCAMILSHSSLSLAPQHTLSAPRPGRQRVLQALPVSAVLTYDLSRGITHCAAFNEEPVAPTCRSGAARPACASRQHELCAQHSISVRQVRHPRSLVQSQHRPFRLQLLWRPHRTPALAPGLRPRRGATQRRRRHRLPRPDSRRRRGGRGGGGLSLRGRRTGRGSDGRDGGR